MEYIKAIKINGDNTAIKVKLADLHHNSDLTRLKSPKNADQKRAVKYKDAIKILDGGVTEET